jgi:membrane associated rhomboid family serine protease
MSSYSERREPITYIRGFAVDLTTLLTAVHVLASVLAVFAFAAGYREWCYDHLVFSTKTFLAGAVWTPLTDPFFHDLSYEHIWLVLSLALFWWFGREVEAVLGRLKFGLLYASVILVPVLVAFPASVLLGGPMGIRVPFLAMPAQYAVFCAFCMMYPGVLFWPGIAAKWVALVYTAVMTLSIIGLPAPRLLVPLYASLGAAWLFMQLCGANRMFDFGEWLGRWKTERAEREFMARQRLEAEEEAEFQDAVDPILEKISREGIQSLTPEEKRRLEKARARLLQKDGGR